MKREIFSFTIFIIIFSAFAGFCGEYYVDSASDPRDLSCDGTRGNPWGSITHALSRIIEPKSEHVIIHIAEGRYDSEQGEIFPLVMRSNISLIGAKMESTILDARGFEEASVIYCENAENVVIGGFTITGGTGTLYESG